MLLVRPYICERFPNSCIHGQPDAPQSRLRVSYAGPYCEQDLQSQAAEQAALFQAQSEVHPKVQIEHQEHQSRTCSQKNILFRNGTFDDWEMPKAA